MMQRQQVVPSQTFGMQEATPATVKMTRNDRFPVTLNEKKKQRDGYDTSQLPMRRQHVFVDSSAYTKTDKNHVAVSRAPEAISLLDNKDITPYVPATHRAHLSTTHEQKLRICR